MEALRDQGGDDFDTVVGAFPGDDGDDVIAKIARSFVEGGKHPGAIAFYDKYRSEISNGIAWAIEDLIQSQD